MAYSVFIQGDGDQEIIVSTDSCELAGICAREIGGEHRVHVARDIELFDRMYEISVRRDAKDQKIAEQGKERRRKSWRMRRTVSA